MVKSKVDGQGLGVIYWYSAWRRYVFSPGYAVFDAACLKEITDFLTTATKEQKEKK